MPNRCLYCGSVISDTARFCRGHNIAYKKSLLARLFSGDTTVIPELERFNWMPPGYSVGGARSSTNQSTSVPLAPVTPERTFGVEIEFLLDDSSRVSELLGELRQRGVDCSLENYGHNTPRNWKIVTDGSLRPQSIFEHGIGRELVSPILRGDAGREQVKKVCAALEVVNAKVNTSCGLHIHFGTEDLNIIHFKKLFQIYWNHEDLIDSMVPCSRRGNSNTYCKSMRTFTLAQVSGVCSIGGLTNLISSRYMKLNYQAYERHRTLEFRQHSGTVEAEKILHWLTFCNSLIDWAKSAVPVQTDLFIGASLSQEEVDWWNRRISKLSNGTTQIVVA